MHCVQKRSENRAVDSLRPVRITPGFTEMAAGSVLIECGKTRVLCTASVEENTAPFLRGTGKGWVTAEYAMLPGATPQRKKRDGIKKDGRSVEIQRLIGRSLRAVCDLHKLGERSIYLDCDVIQADGGTRTASITGAFVALCLAVDKLLKEGKIIESPIVRQVAAVSVGVVDDQPMLDIDYAEDSSAQVDMNVVMTRDAAGNAEFAEVQGTGEERTFSRNELNTLLDLGQVGVEELMRLQREALGDAARVIAPKAKLVLGTGNLDKLKEMRMMLQDHFDVVSLKELGIDVDVEETGTTFEENALIKARAFAQLTGCAALSDDSGLEVDALDGRPGIYSARYAGGHGDDKSNNEKLLQELENIAEPRTGRYVCAIALCRPGKPEIVVRGECEGEILREYRGDGGFGYDPLFYSYDCNMTWAQAPIEEKNRISHRARAIQALLNELGGE